MATSLNKSLRDSIRKQAFDDKKIKRDFRVLVERQFRSAHKKLMASFDGHAVTKELAGGPGGGNITGTLNEGNLFGFIGFDANASPITPLRKALAGANILIHRSDRRTFTHVFKVHMPTKEELYKLTPLPWASGISWVYALEEKGLSNLGQYVFTESSRSRSSAGIQADLPSGGTLRISYLNPILREFEEDLNSIAGSRIK
jgi:hypothetical protein